jgi:hypothetical protein
MVDEPIIPVSHERTGFPTRLKGPVPGVPWEWPAWVPEPTREALVDFWDGSPGRRFPEDWLRMAENMGAPSFGSTVPDGVLRTASGDAAPAGKFIYAWGNLGLLVGEAGRPTEVWFVTAGDYHWRAALERARVTSEEQALNRQLPASDRPLRDAEEALRHYFCESCVHDLQRRSTSMGNFDCLWHGLVGIGVERDVLREHVDELQHIVNEATQGGRCIPVTVEVMGFDNIKFFEGQQPVAQDDKPRAHIFKILLNPRPAQTSTTIELRGGRWIRVTAWAGASAGIGPACEHDARAWRRDEEHARTMYYEHAQLQQERDTTWRFKDLFIAATVQVHRLEGHPGDPEKIGECPEPRCVAAKAAMIQPSPRIPSYEEAYDEAPLP